MDDLFQTPILVSPHVKKFLTTLYGHSYHLTGKDSIGITIINLLQKSFNSDEFEIDFLAQKTKVPYSVTFTMSIFKTHGFNFSDKQNVIISDFLEKYFREQLYSFTLMQAMTKKSNWKDAMKKYLSIFGINDDDFDVESFYKDFKRRKNENLPNAISRLDEILREKQVLSPVRIINQSKSRFYRKKKVS